MKPTDLMLQRLKELDKKILHEFKLTAIPTEAAVLAPFFSENGEYHILFTKRTEHVAHHKGQICFPGGVFDNEDGDLWTTALRETREEIGIESNRIRKIGELGKVVTPTGFQITPFVGEVETPLVFNPSPMEIAEIISVPVNHLLDDKNFKMITRISDYGYTYEGPVFTYQSHEIWGATGRILMELLEVWKTIIR